MTPAKLLILVIALAVIAKARVAVLPGWVVPVPAVFLMTAVAVCAALVTALVLRLRGSRDTYPAPTPEPAAEVT